MFRLLFNNITLHPNTKEVRQRWELIWFAVVLTICLARNDLISKKESVDVEKLFDLVQVGSYQWAKDRMVGGMIPFSE
ncbi:hypothetical protein SLE2022_152630 [Rubroshorea leprosula]